MRLCVFSIGGRCLFALVRVFCVYLCVFLVLYVFMCVAALCVVGCGCCVCVGLFALAVTAFAADPWAYGVRGGCCVGWIVCG